MTVRGFRSIALVGMLPVLAAVCARSPSDVKPTAIVPATVARATDFHIVPRPVEVNPVPGHLALSTITTVTVSDPTDDRLHSLANFTTELWRAALGVDLTMGSDREGPASPVGRIELVDQPLHQQRH